MGKFKDLSKDVNSLFDRTRASENRSIELATKLDIVISNQIKSDRTFETHDRREMEKYDTQDRHVMAVNDTLKDVSNKLDIVVTTQSSMVSAIKDTDDRLTIVEHKQNKHATIGSTIVTVILCLWAVSTWWLTYNADNSKTPQVISRQYKEGK